MGSIRVAIRALYNVGAFIIALIVRIGFWAPL